MQSRVEFDDQLEAARSEWFIQGTEQTGFAINSIANSDRKNWTKGIKHQKLTISAAPAAGRITAPAPDTIVALDPDIPPRHQRLSFSAEGQGVRWLMDGKEFASGSQAQWLPWPGRHVVQITNERGEVLDEIRLEVRGAGIRPSDAAIPNSIHNRR